MRSYEAQSASLRLSIFKKIQNELNKKSSTIMVLPILFSVLTN